jgi:hypothetical protein
MKVLKTLLSSVLILTAITTNSSAFEQNGVKEGNNRISASATLRAPDGKDESIQFIGQYGKFLTNDIEVMVDIFTATVASDTVYLLGLGANYYFLKTPTLTPYVGAQYYRSGQTGNSNASLDGDKIYVGTHKFLTENFAVTPEAGARFIDFTEYSESYLNVYLTYFFD